MKLYLFIISFLTVQFSFAQEVSQDTSVKIWSLEDCITYALENNITVKDATLDKNIAAVDYKKAKSSRLPNLFGSASQSFSSGNTIDPITSDYVTDQIFSTNIGLNSNVTLYQGGQLKNQIQLNKILLDQSLFFEEIEKNNIILNILETYLQILYSKESIAIAENNLAASETEVLRAKARLDAGTIAMSDYTEAQSQAATNQYNVIASKNEYQQYIIALKQLLELSPMEEIEIETIQENMDWVNLNLNKMEVYENALSFLPEVQASQLNIEAIEKELDYAKGGFLPILSLSGSLGTGYTSISDNSFPKQLNVNFNQKLGLTLTVPIFNRNQTKSVLTLMSLKSLQEELPESQFMRVYRSFIFSLKNIDFIERSQIVINDQRITVSDQYKPKFLEFVNNNSFN